MEATISAANRQTADRTRRWLRITIAALVAVVLAAVLLLQAAAIVLAKRSPDLAATFGPAAGLALEAEALRLLSANTAAKSDLPAAARIARPVAQDAWLREPLTVAAAAIMVLGLDDADKRRAALDHVQRLNRRHSLIQGLIIEDGLARRDYPVTIRAMDRILRTAPAQSATFFPLLAQALTYPAAQGEMVRIVDGSADWHHRFLEYAVNQPTAIEGLARYRLQSDFAVPKVDRLLVSALAGQTRLDLAQRVHRQVTAKATAASQARWADDFPPFDWFLSDQPGLRAQTDPAGEALELFVRGGNGGVLARRIVPADVVAAGIALQVDGVPENREDSVQLAITCAENGRTAYEVPLRNGLVTYAGGAAAARCRFPQIELRGRSYTGEQAVRVSVTDPRGAIS